MLLNWRFLRALNPQNQTMMEAHLKDVLDQMTDLEV
jgi:hypothetical protein